MCTCGIDIATQHDTPAMHSNSCSAAGDMPKGRSEASAAADVAAVGASTACAGGLRR